MKKKFSVIFVITIIALAAVLSMSSCSLNYALKTDISKCEISFDLDKYEYSGEEIFPNVTIKYFTCSVIILPLHSDLCKSKLTFFNAKPFCDNSHTEYSNIDLLSVLRYISPLSVNISL